MTPLGKEASEIVNQKERGGKSKKVRCLELVDCRIHGSEKHTEHLVHGTEFLAYTTPLPTPFATPFATTFFSFLPSVCDNAARKSDGFSWIFRNHEPKGLKLGARRTWSVKCVEFDIGSLDSPTFIFNFFFPSHLIKRFCVSWSRFLFSPTGVGRYLNKFVFVIRSRPLFHSIFENEINSCVNFSWKTIIFEIAKTNDSLFRKLFWIKTFINIEKWLLHLKS